MIAPSWHEKAACRGADVDTFHPLRYKAASVEEAKRHCRSCPVKALCQAWIFDVEATGRREGIYGALTPKERSSIAKGTGRICQVCGEYRSADADCCSLELPMTDVGVLGLEPSQHGSEVGEAA